MVLLLKIALVADGQQANFFRCKTFRFPVLPVEIHPGLLFLIRSRIFADEETERFKPLFIMKETKPETLVF